MRLSHNVIFKPFHNVFCNRPQIDLWHTHKEIEQRFEVNTKVIHKNVYFPSPQIR